MLDQYTIEELLRVLKAEADGAGNDTKNICNVCIAIFEKVIKEARLLDEYRRENLYDIDRKLSFDYIRIDELERKVDKLSEKLNEPNK